MAIKKKKRIVKRRATPAAKKHKPVFTRRNGGEFTAAQQLYEKFHGKASSQTITVVSSDRYRENLGALGQLQSLLILSAAMLEPVQLEFTSQHPVLCASPDGSSLYVEGGDQSVDTSRLGFSGANWKKDLMTLGALLEVTYRTKKDFHRFELIDYYHQLGEETGALPIVAYDALNKRIMLIGGQYDIRREGITN